MWQCSVLDEAVLYANCKDEGHRVLVGCGRLMLGVRVVSVADQCWV